MASEMMQYMAKIGIDDSMFNPTLEGMASKLLSFTTSATAGFAAVGVAMGVMVQKFQEMASTAHEMEELSAVIGVSTLELQKFQYAAALAGESATAYDGMIAKLTLGMGKAKDAASEQAKAFAALGVSPEGKSTDQVFVEVFQKLQKVDDAATRAEISMTLFGRSWVEAGKLGNHYLENLEKINSATYKNEEAIGRLAEEQAKWNALVADGTRNTENFMVALMKISDQANILQNWLGKAALSADDLAKSGQGMKDAMSVGAPSGIDEQMKADSALFAQVSAQNRTAAMQELSALNQEYSKGAMTAATYNAERKRITGQESALSAGGSVGSPRGFDQGGQAGWGGGYGFSAQASRATEYQRSQVDVAAIDAWLSSPSNLALIDNRDIVAASMRESMINIEALKKPTAPSNYRDTSNITIINYNSGNASPAEIANATAESVDRLLAGA